MNAPHTTPPPPQVLEQFLKQAVAGLQMLALQKLTTTTTTHERR